MKSMIRLKKLLGSFLVSDNKTSVEGEFLFEIDDYAYLIHELGNLVLIVFHSLTHYHGKKMSCQNGE